MKIKKSSKKPSQSEKAELMTMYIDQNDQFQESFVQDNKQQVNKIESSIRKQRQKQIQIKRVDVHRLKQKNPRKKTLHQLSQINEQFNQSNSKQIISSEYQSSQQSYSQSNSSSNQFDGYLLEGNQSFTQSMDSFSKEEQLNRTLKKFHKKKYLPINSNDICVLKHQRQSNAKIINQRKRQFLNKKEQFYKSKLAKFEIKHQNILKVYQQIYQKINKASQQCKVVRDSLLAIVKSTNVSKYLAHQKRYLQQKQVLMRSCCLQVLKQISQLVRKQKDQYLRSYLTLMTSLNTQTLLTLSNFLTVSLQAITQFSLQLSCQQNLSEQIHQLYIKQLNKIYIKQIEQIQKIQEKEIQHKIRSQVDLGEDKFREIVRQVRIRWKGKLERVQQTIRIFITRLKMIRQDRRFQSGQLYHQAKSYLTYLQTDKNIINSLNVNKFINRQYKFYFSNILIRFQQNSDFLQNLHNYMQQDKQKLKLKKANNHQTKFVNKFQTINLKIVKLKQFIQINIQQYKILPNKLTKMIQKTQCISVNKILKYLIAKSKHINYHFKELQSYEEQIKSSNQTQQSNQTKNKPKKRLIPQNVKLSWIIKDNQLCIDNRRDKNDINKKLNISSFITNFHCQQGQIIQPIKKAPKKQIVTYFCRARQNLLQKSQPSSPIPTPSLKTLLSTTLTPSSLFLKHLNPSQQQQAYQQFSQAIFYYPQLIDRFSSTQLRFIIGEKERASRRLNKVKQDKVIRQVRSMRDGQGNILVDRHVHHKVNQYQGQLMHNQTPLPVLPTQTPLTLSLNPLNLSNTSLTSNQTVLISHQTSVLLNKLFQKKSLPYTYSNSTIQSSQNDQYKLQFLQSRLQQIQNGRKRYQTDDLRMTQ